MRTISEATAWAKAHIGQAAPGGPGHCQELVRTAYAIPAWSTSAKLAFARIPHDQIHTGKDWHAIPAGAMVYFPTLSDYGHVILSLGAGRAVSNDYPNKRGLIVECPVEIPDWHGSEHFGGWSMWTPFGAAH